jgi:hypothetical protein
MSDGSGMKATWGKADIEKAGYVCFAGGSQPTDVPGA